MIHKISPRPLYVKCCDGMRWKTKIRRRMGWLCVWCVQAQLKHQELIYLGLGLETIIPVL